MVVRTYYIFLVLLRAFRMANPTPMHMYESGSAHRTGLLYILWQQSQRSGDHHYVHVGPARK